MQRVNELIRKMEQEIGNEAPAPDIHGHDDLKVGVDLGTANIVITVLDKNDQPVAGAIESANVVKDGIVVDYIQAVQILRKLKAQVEKRLGRELDHAATAIPPGIMQGNVKVITNVVEAAGFHVTQVVDEPVAAAKLLNIADGAVVDIGGGTTGISILKNGEVMYSVDEPTGGTHLTLVVAGSLGLPIEEAEMYKTNPDNYPMTFPIVRPVLEKMAHITLHSVPQDVKQIYLVGGTSCLKGIEDVFFKYTSIQTTKPENPLLVTPFGIAMYDG